MISRSVEETKAGLRIKATKSEKLRSFTISRTTLDVLQEHLARLSYERGRLGSNYENNGLLFPRPDGNYYRPDQVSGRVREFMKRAGLSGSSLHSLRYFVASYLLSSGTPLPAVSESGACKSRSHVGNLLTCYEDR